MNTTTETYSDTTVAARIAGEDIACGDFVSVLNEIIELPSFLWNGSAISLAAEEPVRIRYAANDAGQPYKVMGICLPFVYVKTPNGAIITMDTRQRQLVRLNKNCALAVWNELTKSRSKKKRK